MSAYRPTAVEIGNEWKARRDRGMPCWCGKPIQHTGWPVCSERAIKGQRPPRNLADKVWCLTCEHTHIPTIPVTTWACAECGFGSWDEAVAEDHATFLDHSVYPLHHQAVKLASAESGTSP